MSYIGGGGGGGGGWSPPAPPASTPLHSYSIGVGSRGAGGRLTPLTSPTVYIITPLQYCNLLDIVPHLCFLTGDGNHI